MNPINEAEILEAKNNLKNVSENINVEEIAEENDMEVEVVENAEDFPDINSEINETAEMVMEKRMEEVENSFAQENDKEGIEDEVDSSEVVADEDEEVVLDDELFESSDMSYKTASSTASIASNEKDFLRSDDNELLSLHLPGSVQEMKAIIDLRKKKDERIDNKFDLWQKHSIIQAL